jgi:hypothetical protein
MELGPLPYPRKRTAPTVSRSPKAASGAAAMHGVLYHRSGVFSICYPTECFGGSGRGPRLNHSRDGAGRLAASLHS